MRLVFFPYPMAVVEFLKEHDYPNEYWIDPDNMARALPIQLYTDDALVGYFWFAWTDARCQELEWHLCIAPEWRGKWGSRRMLVLIRSLVELYGCDGVIARPVDETIGHQLERIGFVSIGNGKWFYNLDDPGMGRWKDQLEELDGRFSKSASTNASPASAA